jgi:hypothetical protein
MRNIRLSADHHSIAKEANKLTNGLIESLADTSPPLDAEELTIDDGTLLMLDTASYNDVTQFLDSIATHREHLKTLIAACDTLMDKVRTA